MASLFAALTVAVGGLAAQSSALGNISDNLSNSQTIGFKSIDTSFQDLVTESSSSVNDPGGVIAKPQYENNVQGNLVQSSIPTSLAIQGNGFFGVTTATSGGNTLFTRQGDFTVDKNGFLVNSSGYFLTGYAADPVTGALNTSAVAPIQISSTANNPVPTSTANYVANLPSSATTPYTSPTSTIQIFDSLGNTHNMSFSWVKSTSAANAWTLNLTVSGGGTPTGGGAATDLTEAIPFTFNGTTNIGTIAGITAANGATYTVPNSTTGTAANVVFSGANALNFTTFGAGSQPLTLNFGTFGASNGLTQFADTTTTVTSFTQNGLPRGSFTNLSIDNLGNVSLNYSNGSLKTIGQIPLVSFNSPDSLQRVSGDAFEATLASGTANTNIAGVAGNGTIVGGSLESSNVDIATQFTNMIQAQQVYSANAKTITTVDQMLNTVINTIQ